MLFIQFKGNEDVLNNCQKISEKIDKALMIHALGQSYGLSFGDGTANVEYELTNWDAGLAEVMKVLQQENVLHHVVLGKRIYLTEDDYNYDIFYPLNYSGLVNPF